jgi:hypothetical protein
MIITGIANRPNHLHERTTLPSSELVFLASEALKEYKATHLITSLSPGWELALADAANELDLPYTVAIPCLGRDEDWQREARIRYYDLLARAYEVYQTSDTCTEKAVLECHQWMADRADLILALWNYEFYGNTYKIIDYGIKRDITVTNLWRDWEALYTLKRNTRVKTSMVKRGGAQVFEARTSHQTS